MLLNVFIRLPVVIRISFTKISVKIRKSLKIGFRNQR